MSNRGAKSNSVLGIEYLDRRGERHRGWDRVMMRDGVGRGERVAIRFLHWGPIQYAICLERRNWVHPLLPASVAATVAGGALLRLLGGGRVRRENIIVERG